MQTRQPISSLALRNIVVGGHRTSVRLEPTMWDALREIARRQQLTIGELITKIDRERSASSLTSAIRVYVVDFYRSAAAPAGAVAHREAERAPRH